MTESGEYSDGLRDRLSARGEEALGELAQTLLDNPVLNQALQAAFGAREAALGVTQQAFKNLNLPTATEIDRLARRVRSVSDRLEGVEDSLDQLSRDIASLRKQLAPEPSISHDQARLPTSRWTEPPAADRSRSDPPAPDRGGGVPGGRAGLSLD